MDTFCRWKKSSAPLLKRMIPFISLLIVNKSLTAMGNPGVQVFQMEASRKRVLLWAEGRICPDQSIPDPSNRVRRHRWGSLGLHLAEAEAEHREHSYLWVLLPQVQEVRQ